MEIELNDELLKAALQTSVDQTTRMVIKFNQQRLKRKREKKEKENQKNKEIPSVKLGKSERIDGQIVLDTALAERNILQHIEEVERWADFVKFSDLPSKRTLKSIYVQLDTYLIPVKKHLSKTERDKKLPLEEAVISSNDHCIILGQPGAGKTTSLKKVSHLFANEKVQSDLSFPLLLRFRHLTKFDTPTPILDFISSIIPLQFIFKGSLAPEVYKDIEQIQAQAIITFLNKIRPIIILDGFDELPDADSKEKVLKELQTLTQKLTHSKLVLSCRSGEFNYELDHSKTFEIAPLNTSQIELFVKQWLNDEKSTKDFLEKVRNSPFSDTSIKPLSLAHLCAIYERIGQIPDQPKTIYRKVVNLLIEEWDEQRMVRRTSSLDQFQSDEKFEILSHLSYYLTTTYKSTIFNTDQFKEAYSAIHLDHDLPPNKAGEVVKELESHTGIFLESGYQTYEFVHKSIQEYLTAEFIVKLPSLKSVRKHFAILGSELAIAVSISSKSIVYYVELILSFLSRVELPNTFYNSFTSRIVSENPRFKHDMYTGLATMVLISNWINPGNKNFRNIDPENINTDEYDNFFALAECLELQQQKTKISDFYYFHEGIHDNEFVELRRTKTPVEYKRLPGKIYLPTEFYMMFNK